MEHKDHQDTTPKRGVTAALACGVQALPTSANLGNGEVHQFFCGWNMIGMRIFWSIHVQCLCVGVFIRVFVRGALIHESYYMDYYGEYALNHSEFGRLC